MAKVTVVNSVETLAAKLVEMREAHAKFATFTQAQVDEICKQAAMAADKARIPLAKMAHYETGMGVIEDKVIKNNYAAEHIYNYFRDAKTCGVIAENKADPSMLMGVMQKAQDIYGYLPIEVQKIIADGMGVPLEKIYGVATFYAQFALSPKGKYNISVCLGTACYVKGAGDIFDKLSERLGIGADECTADGKYSLTACRCIGACGLAPVLTVNEDVYGRLTVDDVDDILAKYAD